MSFYGTVFYEFEQVFFKFQFHNNNNDNVNIIPQDSTNGTIASVRWDTFNLDSGNRWIGMKTMDEDGSAKGVSVFHAAAGPAKQQIETLTIPNDGSSGTELQSSQNIEVPIINYDNAGHIVNSTPVRYTLPAASKVVEEGMTNHFTDNFNITSIQATDNSIDEYVELNPGDIISVSKLGITNKGVINDAQQVFFKLPASDAEKDYQTIQNEISIIKTDIDNIEKYHEENDFASVKAETNQNTADIVAANERITSVQTSLEETIATGDDELQKQINKCAPLSLTGNAPKGFDTFEAALGNLEASADAMGSAVGIEVEPSVAGQFQTLVTYAGLMYWQLSIANSKIKELEDRIETLENK